MILFPGRKGPVTHEHQIIPAFKNGSDISTHHDSLEQYVGILILKLLQKALIYLGSHYLGLCSSAYMYLHERIRCSTVVVLPWM